MRETPRSAKVRRSLPQQRKVFPLETYVSNARPSAKSKSYRSLGLLFFPLIALGRGIICLRLFVLRAGFWLGISTRFDVKGSSGCWVSLCPQQAGKLRLR